VKILQSESIKTNDLRKDMERPNESSIVYFVRDKVAKLKGKKA